MQAQRAFGVALKVGILKLLVMLLARAYTAPHAPQARPQAMLGVCRGRPGPWGGCWARIGRRAQGWELLLWSKPGVAGRPGRPSPPLLGPWDCVVRGYSAPPLPPGACMHLPGAARRPASCAGR